ncbi:MAG: aminoacyl-tRNA hydrolase [Hyphomicrobiales bacterium]|nr:aminoacyl-tRNA hydrolase [Hyphomicrobiales bacterium]
MKLLVGLGNPGSQYRANRHNIGFMALDTIAETARFSPFRSRWHGEVSEGRIGDTRVLLLKPMTFMNESGKAVGEALRHSNLTLADVTVFHDELDLAPGKVRVKLGGGNAGHNGLRSISALCGNDYRRVRLGIGHPGEKSLVHPYVLGNFFADEWPWVKATLAGVAAAIELLVEGADASFQNRVDLATKGRPAGQ